MLISNFELIPLLVNCCSFPTYGDNPHAWAGAFVNDWEFVHVRFAQPVFVTGIDLYETFNPGALPNELESLSTTCCLSLSPALLLVSRKFVGLSIDEHLLFCYHAGHVVNITVLNPEGAWQLLWSGPVQVR